MVEQVWEGVAVSKYPDSEGLSLKMRLPWKDHTRGFAQSPCEKINIIMTIGGRGLSP